MIVIFTLRWKRMMHPCARSGGRTACGACGPGMGRQCISSSHPLGAAGLKKLCCFVRSAALSRDSDPQELFLWPKKCSLLFHKSLRKTCPGPG
jgi:hypothetical protein